MNISARSSSIITMVLLAFVILVILMEAFLDSYDVTMSSILIWILALCFIRYRVPVICIAIPIAILIVSVSPSFGILRFNAVLFCLCRCSSSLAFAFCIH